MKKPRKQHDELLKGAFEEWFTDFLGFVYPDATILFDFSRELTFMDKELHSIIPQRERKKGKRVADLLVKVYLRDGTEKRILLHTEIEGGSQQDFAFRLFQYHYRLLDRYRVPVETIAVFTGGRNQHKPTAYRYQGIGTSIHFQFLSYDILNHTETVLLEMDNPFALVVLACQKALSEGKIPDAELGEDRLSIARALLRHHYDHDRIISFLVFLKNFLYIDNQEINRKFDQIVEHLTGGKIDMGVIEAIKQQERREGKAEGQQEEALTIARELKKEGLSVEFIARMTKLPLEVIAKL